MTHSRRKTNVSFDAPAEYRIVVKGRIDDLWAESLGGLHIRFQSHGGEDGVTTLSGQIKDQTELIGVLYSVYELHLPILLVELAPK